MGAQMDRSPLPEVRGVHEPLVIARYSPSPARGSRSTIPHPPEIAALPLATGNGTSEKTAAQGVEGMVCRGHGRQHTTTRSDGGI